MFIYDRNMKYNIDQIDFKRVFNFMGNNGKIKIIKILLSMKNNVLKYDDYIDILHLFVYDIDDQIIYSKKFNKSQCYLLLQLKNMERQNNEQVTSNELSEHLIMLFSTLDEDFVINIMNKLVNPIQTISEEYINTISKLLLLIQDTTINKLKIEKYKKAYLFYLKYGENRPELIKGVPQNQFFIDFISIENNQIVIEGKINYYPFINDGCPKINVYVNGEKYSTEKVNRINTNLYLNKQVKLDEGFKFNMMLDKKVSKQEISFELESKNITMPVTSIIFNEHAPLSEKYKNSYYEKDNWIIKQNSKGLILTSRKKSFKDEIMFLNDLWNKNEIGGKKAILVRILCHILIHFKKKKIWLIADRAEKADDNGEILLDYIYSLPTHKEDLHKNKYYFVINKSSLDYKRIKKKFHVVPFLSMRYKILILVSDYLVSGYLYGIVQNPFPHYNDPYRDIAQNLKVIFLDHGVKKENLSKGLNKYVKNWKLMICSGKPEYQSIFDENYGYEKNNIALTGLCRYDRLYNNSKDNKVIAVMPTWRKYLTTGFSPKTQKHVLEKNFTDSTYYKFYYELLTSEKLKSKMNEYGYSLYFVAHPTMFPYIDYFKNIQGVKIFGAEVIYRDIYAMSSLLVTDYSSVVFDFANLYKPIIYSQFDFEECYGSEGHRSLGYFDYERDGFGEVEYSLDDTINRIIEYIENDFKLKNTYKERIDNFFAFHDKNNCKRVYEAIQKCSDNHLEE